MSRTVVINDVDKLEGLLAEEISVEIGSRILDRISWALNNTSDWPASEDEEARAVISITFQVLTEDDGMSPAMLQKCDIGAGWFIQCTDDMGGWAVIATDDGSGSNTGTANAFYWLN